MKKLEKRINKKVKTNVEMIGTVRRDNIFEGKLVGESVDELYRFVEFIAIKRGRAFEEVAFRYYSEVPLRYSCSLKFSLSEVSPKTFLQRLFRK